MKKNMITFSIVLLLLFGALIFIVMYQKQNQEKIEGNPYGKSTLNRETIEQLDDPLYQNQILPDDLETKLENKEDVTIYFYASDCSHCKATTPVLVPMTEDLGIDMKKLNLREFEAAWDTFQIEGTPTLVHYENGEEVARISGEQPELEFESFFNEYVLGEESS